MSDEYGPGCQRARDAETLKARQMPMPSDECAGCVELREDNARLRFELRRAHEAEDIIPDHVYRTVDESAAERALKDEISTQAARADMLELELRREREKFALTDRDYRRVCNELAEMQRPEMREGRERRLLEQLGESQAAMLEAQHQMRLANVRAEMQPGYRFADPDERERQKLAAEQQLRAGYNVYRQEAKTLGCREEVAARAMLTSGPADRAYYERLLDEVNNTKAASVNELRRKVAGFLAEAMDALDGADLEPPRK